MTKAICLSFGLLLTSLGTAQKQDYTWVIGHDYNFDDNHYGRIVLNYRLGPTDNPGAPCSPVVVSSTLNIQTTQCSAWPNPAFEQLHFESPQLELRNISLTNAIGNLVRDVNLSGQNNTYTMAVSDLRPGVYFWRVKTSDGGVFTGKTLINR